MAEAVHECREPFRIVVAGDHCCEYMTGGGVVVLSNTGKNLGAGMTGGSFLETYNSQFVRHDPLSDEDKGILQHLILQHLEKTESARAKEILGDWQKFAGKFWKVHPRSGAPKAAPAPAQAEPAKA